LEVHYHSQRLAAQLNVKQRQIYDFVMDHYTCLCNPQRVPTNVPGQLLLQVDRKAGTGKSFVIMLLSAYLQQYTTIYGQDCPIIRAAPTGAAAYGIQWRTLHSLFCLPIKASDFQPLPPASVLSLQATLRGCKYLILDEKSMVSLHTMGWLDNRCRQIFPRNADKYFGGLNIIMSLPEVMSFDNAIQIYGRRKDVEYYNHTRLRDSRKPVLKVKASYQGSNLAYKATTEEA
jgi:hypothetical protein